MPITLDTVRTVTSRLPFDSCSNMVLRWFNAQNWLDAKDVNFSTFASLSEKSIDTTALIAARLGFTFFIFPHVTTPAAIYNLSVGVCYISMGFILAFKGVRTEEDQKIIAKSFHIGFIHTLTAVYDFAIGRLVQVPVLGWAAVVVFALFPQVVLRTHALIFKTPSLPLSVPELKNQNEEKDVETTPSSLSTSPVVVESKPNLPLPRAYLEKGCQLDKIARRYALRLVPSLPPQTSSDTFAQVLATAPSKDFLLD